MAQRGSHYLRRSLRHGKRDDEEPRRLGIFWILFMDMKWRMRRLAGVPSSVPYAVALKWLAWELPVIERVGDNEYLLVKWRKP